jgi:hypothetical protein
MKKETLLFFALFTTITTCGQTNKPAETRTVIVPSHSAQKIQTYTPQQESDSR